MDILETVVRNLTSDEVRRFKILSNRFKADEEKKLIVLFDAVRSGKYDGEDDKLVSELYGGTDARVKNRYYRLRNKLLDNIEKSLVFYHFKYKDSIHAYYDIQLSVLFRERGNYPLAKYFLKKAEKKARSLDQFDVLETIYGEYTKLALKNIEVDIDTVLKRRKANRAKLRIHRENTEVLAIITQQLRKRNFARGSKSVKDMLSKVRKRLEKSADIFESVEGRLLIFRAVSTQLLHRQAYDQLADYLRSTLAEFEEGKLFSNDNHETRLLMRLWLANSLFKTFRFTAAEEEVKTLEKEMRMYSKQNFFTYLFHYYNLRINIGKCLGKHEEAGKLIREALKYPEIAMDDEKRMFIELSRADLHFNGGEYDKAFEDCLTVTEAPTYAKLSEDLCGYIELFTLTAGLEAGRFDDPLDACKDFRKRYKKWLRTDDAAPASEFVKALQAMAKEPENRELLAATALGEMESRFPAPEPAGNEVIHYDLFLRSLAEGKSYYALFTERMKRLMA